MNARRGASCGSIAVSEVIPLSKPDILLNARKWLLDPAGPLTIRASSLASILPWFLKFVANSRPSRIEEISGNLARLTCHTLDDFESLFRAFDLTGLIGDRPVLGLYDTEAELVKERQHIDRRRALGLDIREITGAQAAEMEPSIADDFAKALVFKYWRTIIDSKRFVTAMADAFLAAGGKIVSSTVNRFVRNGGTVMAIGLDEGNTVSEGQFVLAAGPWSKRLAKQLDIKLDIEGVIGYQTVFSDPGFEMKHGIVYASGGSV